ncbi:hypothetical protein TrCOL_g41 [Triparma columacea]|uniref:Uncharacterized protein n=1 Tax=Triparma columacea TaxID=722753 RepID=A0A9W7GJC8_9STRA|nr:hypothetical protein TrCOL_g41 [Triparma columacea]
MALPQLSYQRQHEEVQQPLLAGGLLGVLRLDHEEAQQPLRVEDLQVDDLRPKKGMERKLMPNVMALPQHS